MRYMGLDGYRRGWVAVVVDSARFNIYFPANFDAALKLPYDLAMVDMPIGIPPSGNRACDIRARAMLGDTRSRVFTGARRSLFGFRNQLEANAWAKSTGEPGVSCQLFCILPKIIEVDSLMSANLQSTVRETHPELVFARLNGDRPLVASKKSAEGIAERTDILRRAGFRCIDDWLNKRPPYVKPDDVLDASACAIAAQNPHGPIPDHPEIDEKGLRMEMWY